MNRNWISLAFCFTGCFLTALWVYYRDSRMLVAEECAVGEDYLPSVSDGQGGWAPLPIENGDIDANGDVELTDAVYLLNYLFMGGPEPPKIECVRCVEPDTTCIRFVNDLNCQGESFAAELDVCGTKLTSTTGVLSDCVCIEPVDACEICLQADSGGCGPITGCAAPQALEVGKVYTFVLAIGNTGSPTLGLITQDGDCETPLPEAQGAEAKRLEEAQPILVLDGLEIPVAR